MNHAKYLIEQGKINDALQIVLELEQRKALFPQELISCKLFKANLLCVLGKYLDAIKISENIFQDSEKRGDLLVSYDALIIQTYAYMIMVNVSKSEVLIKQAEDLFKKIKGTTSLDLRERESFLLRTKAGIYHYKGELQFSLEITKKAYKLARDVGNKALIVASLNNIADRYHNIGEYDQAIKCAKEAIKVNYEPTMGVALGTLIEIYISKGKVKEAKLYLDQLRNLSEKLSIKRLKAIYSDTKAKVLKLSLRARDRIKSEDIFKDLALNDAILSDIRIDAIINLCDLYLTELRITNDPEIINEIHPYIQKLLDIAENQHSYFYLADTYLLQAKLSLLTLDLKKAKQFLTQAQNIAESYGLKRLAMKVSHEHDELLRQTKMWENLKVSDLTLTERLELTGLNEQMESMVKRRMIEIPEISHDEPVMLLILTEGGNLLFSKQFVEDFSFEDDILGGFLTSINYFITEVFSEGLDRAIFGKYTLLMMPLQPFLLVYIFKGDSYFAHRKLKNFLNSIQNDSVIWKYLQDFFQKSKSVHLEDVPPLELLITEIFLEKEK